MRRLDPLLPSLSAQLRACGHPLRAALLQRLSAGPATNQQLAAALGETPPKVLFHLRVLLAAGLVSPAAEHPAGRASEKYYAPTDACRTLLAALAAPGGRGGPGPAQAQDMDAGRLRARLRPRDAERLRLRLWEVLDEFGSLAGARGDEYILDYAFGRLEQEESEAAGPAG